MPPQDSTPPDGDKRLYCERLKYNELNLAYQANDVKNKVLANPLKREPRQHLFTQYEQIRIQLRNVQTTMKTQCSLTPNFFNFPPEQELKKQLIGLSIQHYPSKCPCPYSGSTCGGRSAWNRAGGYEPYCYVTDIQ